MGGDAAALADSPILFPDDRGRRPAEGRSPTCPTDVDAAITDRFLGITGG